MTEKCEFCDRMFYSRLGLQKHIDRIHFNKELEKPYVCKCLTIKLYAFCFDLRLKLS